MCDEEGDVAVYTQATYKSVFLALENFYDHSLFDVLFATGQKLHFNAVAGEGGHRVALGYKDGRTTIVGNK